MQIESGGKYQTRSGDEAVVAAELPPSPFAEWIPIGTPYIGYIKSNPLKIFKWRSDGKSADAERHDLIAEWREPVTKEVTLYLYRVNNIVHYASSPIENVIGSAKVTLTEGKFA